MENVITKTAMPSRTLEQITESARIHVQGAGQNLLQLGQDMLDAKALLGHGQWMPWLREIGQSARTAENLMRLAREIQPGTVMANLPYTKALALLALPESERESFAAANEDKSAAEIKRLIAERDQIKRERDSIASAYEKANVRATRAEKDLYDEQHKPLQQIKVEVMPEDYETLRMQASRHRQEMEEAAEAAEDAERRAEAAERELQQLRMSGIGQREDPIRKASSKMDDFMISVQMWPYQPALAVTDRARISDMVHRMEDWCADMRKMLDGVPLEAGEAAIV